jgi:hypothetical protein
MVSITSGLSANYDNPEVVWCKKVKNLLQKSLEVIEKSVPLQPDSKKHGLRGVLKKTETRKKVEKF